MGMTLLRHVLMDKAGEGGDAGAGGGGDGAAAAGGDKSGGEGDKGGGGGDDAGKGGGGGEGDDSGKAASDARKFISDFVHDPKALEGMDDAAVTAYHERLNAAIDKVRPAGGKWPDNWRQEFAGDDADLLKRFERYQSPKDIAQALVAAQKKIASGELKTNKPFPEKGTDEEKAAWRKEVGLPEKPDGYQIKLKDGLVIGDDDKPIIDAFLASAHARNMTSEQVSSAIDWYYDEIDRQTQARADEDKRLAQECTDALIKEWGNDYRANMNIMSALLDSAPAGVKEGLLYGRLADGRPIGSSPEVLQWLALTARTINPVASVIPNAGGNIAGAIDDEIKEIEGWMGAQKGTAEYKKYWDSDKTQARYRELISARERSKAQG